MTLERGRTASAEAVRTRLAAVQERITGAGGDLRRITIVAVTKGFGADTVTAALDAGLVDLGENYAQELEAKATAATTPTATAAATATTATATAPRWHFLGRVQRNKVRHLAPLVDLWQSVDRIEAGREIASRARRGRVLVQVNISGEPQKNGCLPDEAPELVDRLTDLGLDVRGLMAVGPTGPPEGARPGFRQLVQLADRLGLPERSMGMTDDLEVAVQEGTTMVRIGRALFGPRPGPGPSSRPDPRSGAAERQI